MQYPQIVYGTPRAFQVESDRPTKILQQSKEDETIDVQENVECLIAQCQQNEKIPFDTLLHADKTNNRVRLDFHSSFEKLKIVRQFIFHYDD